MRKINKIEPLMPALPTRKKVAAYARVSMESERLQHSLSAQVSYYSELIQSIIQTLQEDIDTLADNLENAFPVSIDRGGTNGTTKVSAQQNLGISYESTELTSGTVAAYADALGDREHKVVLGISGQSVTDLPNDATCTIEIYKFDANSVLCRATTLDGTEFIRTKKNGTWGSWNKTLQAS